MKQYPRGLSNDWQCQRMWNGCKKLRQLCISSTQYDACAAYVHTFYINMPFFINVPITSPPDNACIALWQPDQLHRVWVSPASKCNWEDYNPKSWHSVMLFSVHHSFSDAPAIKQMPIKVDPSDPPDKTSSA